MDPVNRIPNLPSYFMHVTGICDYPYRTNICKFIALLDFCPHACYLTPLVCYSLTPNAEISRTVGYKSASRCCKNPLLLIQYFKLLNPSVFSKPAVISWNVNSKFLRARTLHVVLMCALHVWCNNRLYINRRTFPTLAAIFLLALDCAMQLWTYLCLMYEDL